MRSDQGSIFAGTLMDENAETRLRHILERPGSLLPVDTGNFKKLKAAYNACLDESTARKRGIGPLLALLADLQRTYPIQSGLVTGTQHHLTNAILLLMRSGVTALISPRVSVCFTKVIWVLFMAFLIYSVRRPGSG